MFAYFKRLMSRFSSPSDIAAGVLLILSLTVAAVPLATAETPSSIMSRAMIAMMDTMGNLAQEYKGRGNWSFGNRYSPNNNWSGFGGYPAYGYSSPGYYNPGPHYAPPLQTPVPGAVPISPLMSPLQGYDPYQSPVDGIWVGQSGEIVLVMYGHFRIYASAETYRDGRFEISADRLAMLDPESGYIMEFDYLLDDGRMILRNDSGGIMLFKQLPIPIPPYNLFAGAPTPYPQNHPFPYQDEDVIPPPPLPLEEEDESPVPPQESID
jgi:hypothetical protein